MLSIIVTWRDRDELKIALPSLQKTASLVEGEIVIVNYGGTQKRFLDQIHGSYSGLKLVQVNNQRYFHKARAQNIGAAQSSKELFFFCDCDIIVNPRQIYELALRIVSDPGLFGTLAGVKESIRNSRGASNVVMFGYELWIRIANGAELKIVDNEEDASDGSRQAPGLLLVRRDDFEAVNGYNGRLHGWGWEDQDMIARLTLSRRLKRFQSGHAIHISHGEAARTANYPPTADRWESRDRMFRQALDLYDKNDFEGTFCQDVKDLAPVIRVDFSR